MLAQSPAKAIHDMYAQIVLSAASAFRALLPVSIASFLLAFPRRGITIAAATSNPTPKGEASGRNFNAKMLRIEDPRMYAASA